jgi:hypothetical protein
MAPLQRRALYGLLFGIVWIIAMMVVFLLKGGATTFDQDSNFRLIIDGLWISGLVVYLALFATITRRQNKVDERDKLILDRSSKVQWMATIFSLVAWTIGLSEFYRAEGQVPIVFLYIIFIFILAIGSIAQSAGILIGYWRMNRDG